MNFVAGFDGDSDGVRGDAQEIDVTIDYRVTKGFLNSFWLRIARQKEYRIEAGHLVADPPSTSRIHQNEPS